MERICSTKAELPLTWLSGPYGINIKENRECSDNLNQIRNLGFPPWSTSAPFLIGSSGGPDTIPSTKFGGNLFCIFWEILLTNKQTNKLTKQKQVKI